MYFYLNITAKVMLNIRKACGFWHIFEIFKMVFYSDPIMYFILKGKLTFLQQDTN